jgi:hypothetical protein
LSMPAFSSEAILEVLAVIGGKGSKRSIRTALRQKGYAVPNDEFDFYFGQLLRSGKVRPMLPDASKVEDLYEVAGVGR